MGHHIPQELHYSKTHEWIRVEEDGTCVIGITDFAQKELGDLVFVELPDSEIEVNVGDEVVVVESVKTASEVYAPLSGKITEVNRLLSEKPEMINKSPYEEGWLFRMKIKNKAEIEKLLDSASYQLVVSEE